MEVVGGGGSVAEEGQHDPLVLGALEPEGDPVPWVICVPITLDMDT